MRDTIELGLVLAIGAVGPACLFLAAFAAAGVPLTSGLLVLGVLGPWLVVALILLAYVIAAAVTR